MAKTSSLSHLLDIKSLSENDIQSLLDRASYFSKQLKSDTPIKPRRNKIIASLFYEPSTRTQYSFAIAAHRLGTHFIAPNMMTLSDKKGESLIDTIKSIESMGVDVFVVRHKQNFTPHFIAQELNGTTSLVNAGDGTNQHPTQTLIDLYTIKQRLGRLSNLKISIIGDVIHSRVAQSFIDAANTLNMGELNLVGPASFLPEKIDAKIPIHFHDTLEKGLADADVIIALRVQAERMSNDELPHLTDYNQQYGLTQKTLKFAKADTIILHPGPMIRGSEICSEVADSTQSMISTQVVHSIPVRMAVLDLLMS